MASSTSPAATVPSTTKLSTVAVKPRRRCSLLRHNTTAGSSSAASASAMRNGSSHTSTYRTISHISASQTAP